MDFIDYYKILQLTPTANTDEIKTAYRQLAKTTHPDKNREDKQATSNFQKLNDAYSTLSDTEKRRVYDLEYERQRRLNQPRFYTIGRTSESTNKNTAPFPWFSATFYAEPPPFNPEPMRLFVKIRESEDFIRQFKSCVSSTGKEVRRQKRTIQKKEEAVRALKEDILKQGTEKTRKYAHGGGPSNLNRIKESPQIQAKTRRKAEMEAELKEQEEKLVSLERQLLDFSRRLSYWEKERDTLGPKFEIACESDPLSSERWPFNTVRRRTKKKKQASPDVQPGTREEFEEAERRRRERKGESSQETHTSFQGESAAQSSNTASGN
ncbi:molecular chaperone DnaJ [Fusarium oxysporum f. sp. conglutinans race 2 54008]|uniref:J domain-containing protein n=2 Tax=Fusarium oxysporum f. sp. conglutinans TaxID=100902 RepID=F9F466_FUSOF|nr:hypothetical protein FOXB_01191 [Fusarium oxysporum f. sp. conglutinans Fo5176]EXL75760.1 molecular chaperone DnaJ [Fusarium oxysporum f. sp. conglutinans race 2 54008]KAG7000325.1 DnaJ-like protein dnj-20 [Fusarium oxysporum f. sp. conglutinans]KAI8406056.1 hypothetical protein FOFC_13523 [Fusarium oxysporum]